VIRFIYHIKKALSRKVSIAPVVTFRILFGLLMMGSIARFTWYGWIDAQYIQPDFFFSYYGFDWISPLPEHWMYAVFGLMFIAALGITLGLFYRLSAVSFFLLFTYTELLDKTNYLNHYYFVSLVAFLLIFIPANLRFSLDTRLGRAQRVDQIQALFPIILKFQLCLVYFFAGIAKINTDWLLQAQPLKIWLAAHVYKPLLGWLLRYEWTAYIFSWVGMLFDTIVPFIIWFKPLQKFIFPVLISFHLLTWWLFPIGMFPFIMIGATLIFIDAKWHEKVICFFESTRFYSSQANENHSIGPLNRLVKYAFVLFFILQISFPLRYLLYSGDLFWTEQGYRFSWRVMLMEKVGYATFYVTEGEKKIMVSNDAFLTPQQEKMMATQPDMILQFAHHIEEEYKKKGLVDPKVTADIHVSLNGRRSKLFIDPSVDLTELKDNWQHKNWISVQ
jgi:hypothetical protein